MTLWNYYFGSEFSGTSGTIATDPAREKGVKKDFLSDGGAVDGVDDLAMNLILTDP